MRCPSTRTQLVVLLGTPLGHTLSPAMHNRLFEKLDLDYLYLPVEVSAENLETVFSGLTRMNVAGFNVTIPHKIRVMDLLDAIDPLAEVIGAVNTIRLQGGKTRGYNTDGEGFLTYLEKSLGTPISGKTFFILGSGGAARGIAMTLAVRGAAKIFLRNRTPERAAALAEEINTRIRNCAETVPAASRVIKKVLTTCDILVNTTSVGMHPDTGSPLDPALLDRRLAVVDVVYKPLVTPLLAAARRLGCPAVDGLGMLVHQGALAFKLWTGVDPVVEEMFAAVRPALD